MAKWLDKYEQGGLVLKKKTKDNYDLKANPNDVKASVGPGFVGLGYGASNWKSPAWGGQFQDGGILGKTFLQPNSSKLPSAPTPGGKKGQMSTELAMSIGGEDGQPGYLIPTFKHGKPLTDPEAEFRQTGEHLGGPFKTWQAAEKWGKERHKFVEKGQPIPSPTKTWDEFAMGGGIPGAVGFTYARVAGSAPANGKYTKKTLASAQEGKKMPKAYWTSNDDREAYRKNLKAAAEAALNNNASDEDLLIGTSYHDINSGNNCMNGVCGLNRKAGLIFNAPTDQDRFLSGEKFAQAVAKGDEDYYQVSGNFQIGDHLQYRHKEGSGSHNKIIYGVQADDKGQKIYKVVDNAGGKDMRSRDYTEAELKELVEKGGGGYDKVNIYRPGYNLDKPLLDKEREAKTSPEARAALAERKNIQEWDASHNPGFDYSIRPDSEYYNKQPEGMKKFIDFANDDAKVTELAKKLGVGKDIIHDQLLNTFGELGQENKWADPWFGGDLSKGISPIPIPFESTMEKVLNAVGGGKGWSVGPGQIKFNTLDPELRKQFGINRPKDLHDFNKVIPLMTAINVKNKKWMENQGDELSTKLVGNPGTSADEIKYGVDRWVPYAYQGLPNDPIAAVRKRAEANANEYRLSKKDREDYISNYINKNVDPEKLKTFDEGSYANSVYKKIDENLSRTMPAQNYEQYNELMPVTVKSKKKMQNGGEMAFYQNGLDWKPKSISKNGSKVIKDDMGQWAHPGKITEIGSNNITMQGVDYPVLGVSDTGHTQMMQPGQDYKFDGEKVTEYPMMQEGGWLDKYPEPMRQDATRNVIPIKMTDRERLEASANSDQAQKRALNNAKEVIAERKKNKATKGDLNTPGSWHTEDKARFFPNSVGGVGEMFDEYINPATYTGVLADALGESVAARNPKGIALSLGLAAGSGALGLDPLGSAIKAAPTIGKGLKTIGSKFKGLGMPVREFEDQTIGGGISQAEIDNYIQRRDANNTAFDQRRAAIRQQNTARTPYQPPTDAELARMNEVEANRYAPRVNRTNGQPLGNPYNPNTYEPTDPELREQIQRARADLADTFRTARERSEQRLNENLSNIGSRAVDMNSEELASLDRTISPGVQSIMDEVNFRNSAGRATSTIVPTPPGEWNPNFKFSSYDINEPRNPIERVMEHPSGHKIYEQFKTHRPGRSSTGDYMIRSNKVPGVKMEVHTKVQRGNPYVDINNISFFGGRLGMDEAANRAAQTAADEQLKMFMHAMPEKATLSPQISTSIYSSPIMNAYVAKLAKEPGRVTLEDAGTKTLNKILKSGSGAPGEIEQLLTQFPKIQKSVRMMNERAGTNFFEPYLELQGNKIDPSYLKSDQFEALRQSIKYDNPDKDILHEIDVKVPKYKMTKHWKNGGWLDKYK